VFAPVYMCARTAQLLRVNLTYARVAKAGPPRRARTPPSRPHTPPPSRAGSLGVQEKFAPATCSVAAAAAAAAPAAVWSAAAAAAAAVAVWPVAVAAAAAVWPAFSPLNYHCPQCQSLLGRIGAGLLALDWRWWERAR